jgi:hypothetical protein
MNHHGLMDIDELNSLMMHIKKVDGRIQVVYLDSNKDNQDPNNVRYIYIERSDDVVRVQDKPPLAQRRKKIEEKKITKN